tara:strand:+ start:288 stop:449 length:162 start_codon:yes stop_codon:yes gene_type:complete
MEKNNNEWLEGEHAQLSEKEIAERVRKYQEEIGFVSQIVNGKLGYKDIKGEEK